MGVANLLLIPGAVEEAGLDLVFKDLDKRCLMKAGSRPLAPLNWGPHMGINDRNVDYR